MGTICFMYYAESFKGISSPIMCFYFLFVYKKERCVDGSRYTRREAKSTYVGKKHIPKAFIGLRGVEGHDGQGTENKADLYRNANNLSLTK